MISWYLQGPFPDDLPNLASVARNAIDLGNDLPATIPELEGRRFTEFCSEFRLQPAHEATISGLYILWRLDGLNISMAGFWLIFGNKYLEVGPVGPPDRSPPFVQELLDIATETVWWRWATTVVWPRKKDRWQPLIILEWPEAMAIRSSIAPPGPDSETHTVEIDEEPTGDWLLSDIKEAVSKNPVIEKPPLSLSQNAALITLVRGNLEVSGNTHKGGYTLFSLPPGDEIIPMDTWLEQVFSGSSPPPPPEHTRGGPVALPGPNRVAFSLNGWLTRDLSIWPPAPAAVQPGLLQDRDVGSRWRAQMWQAIASTTLVLIGMLGLVGMVQRLAAPSEVSAPTAPQVAPQPALSVCSPQNEIFMQELRCQLGNLTTVRWDGTPICGDSVTTKTGEKAADPKDTLLISPDQNLHPEICGLLDAISRVEDASNPDATYDLATLSAAKACFNVLDKPYRYARTGMVDRVDPSAFFERGDLAIPALVDMMEGVRSACGVYRTRLETRTEGAILATHIHGSESQNANGDALQSVAVEAALSGRSMEDAECYHTGIRDGIINATSFEDLCGVPPMAELQGRRIGRTALSAIGAEGWRRLGGANNSEKSAATRYLDSRFGGTKLPTLWACHTAMLSEESEGWDFVGAWDVPVHSPRAYFDPGGGVHSQLQLDATLTRFRSGEAVGPCWTIVTKSLERYTPAHPLLAEVDPEAWPIDDQQLCGQICAAWYHVKSPEGKNWVTPDSDLSECVANNGQVPTSDSEERLDPLGIPWNVLRHDDYILPRDLRTEVCSFNMVAQGYFGNEKDGILIEGVSPQAWAGSAKSSAAKDEATESRIAGGLDGIAAMAAIDLSSYGRMSSMAACGAVAAQCFVPMLLEDLHNNRPAASYWIGAALDHRPSLLRPISYTTQDSKRTLPIAPNPWCELVLPYLPKEGALPEGQLDYPCARGIEDTRVRVENYMQTLRGLGTTP